MVYSFDGFNYLIRLDKGDKLAESLEKFATETDIKGGWLTGVGGALEVVLGFFDLDKKEYNWQTFTGLREILSLNGSIAYDEHDKPMLHLHGSFGDREFKTIGGHIKDLTAAATVEIFVHSAYKKPIKRKTDEVTGLKLLDL